MGFKWYSDYWLLSPESPQHGPAHKANSETQTEILIFLFPFAALALSWILSDTESEREREREIRVFDSKHDDDEFMCAVCTRLSSSWFLFDDWSRNFCLYCLRSLLCCFLPQRLGSVLIPFQGIYYSFLVLLSLMRENIVI